MKLIERYIFKKAGLATLVTLGSLAGVVWIVQALKGVDIVANKGQTIFAYLALTTLVVPNLVLAVIPVALLISCIYAINSMNTNTELVVMTASGASNWSVAKPLLVLALLCSLFAGLVGHVISPMSLVKLREFVTEMRADLVSVIVREGTFNEFEKGLTFHVAHRGAGGLLSGILISDERETDSSVIYTAKQGVVTRTSDGSLLKLKEGEIQQTNLKDGNVTVIKYDSYIFDLASFSGKTVLATRRPKERFTSELMFPDKNDKTYQADPGRFRALIHERFSEMLWPFAYVLIVLAFAGQARSNRQSHGAAIGAATIALITARGLGFSAISSLRLDPGSVFLVYALPIGCIVFGSWFVLTNRPASLPKVMMDRIGLYQGRITERIEQIYARYVAFRRRHAGVQT